MNIELRRRIDPLLPRLSPNLNNNDDVLPAALPRRRVVIFKPTRSAMTSGSRRKPWLLEFEPQSKPFVEPLMGWTGSSDPVAHMQLSFASREAAIAYAERQDLAYEVRSPVGAAWFRASERPPDCAEEVVVPSFLAHAQDQFTGIIRPGAVQIIYLDFKYVSFMRI